jgi:hypothetical protein
MTPTECARTTVGNKKRQNKNAQKALKNRLKTKSASKWGLLFLASKVS